MFLYFKGRKMMCLSYYQVTTFAVFRYITKKKSFTLLVFAFLCSYFASVNLKTTVNNESNLVFFLRNPFTTFLFTFSNS